MNAAFMDAAVSFAWCIVQVTLFAAVALVVYGLARRQSSDHNVLLLALSLAIVGALTLVCWSPWPNWAFISRPSIPMTVSNILPATALPVGGTPRASSDGRGEQRHASPRPSPSLRDVPPESFQPPPFSEPLVAVAAADPPWLLLAVGSAWLLAAIGVARFLVGLVFVQRYRLLGIPVDDVALLREFERLCQELEITLPVELREVPSLGVAATIGWRRPMVLLPVAWRDWSADQRRAVLAHELAHVAQRHYPMWFASQLAIAPHFYHPLVIWLGRRLRLEQEIAADQLAARAFGGRRRYTDILAGLALGPLRPAGAFAGLGLFMSRPLLMRRISMLRQPSESVRRPSRIARGLGLLLLALVTIVVAGLRAAPKVVAAADNDLTDPSSAASTDAATGNNVASPTSTAAPEPATDLTPFAGQLAPPTGRGEPAAIAHYVTALVQVSRHTPSLLGRSDAPNSDAEWQIFSRTQIAYLHSYFILQAALHDPEIAGLPLVRAQQDPVQWLIDHLDTGFFPNSEIMSIRMTGRPDEMEQLRKIVDAVVDAYLKEVVFAEDQRKDAARDSLARSLNKLNHELSAKMEEYNALSNELGTADQVGGNGQVRQQLDIKRLERIETELMRLEEQQLRAELRADLDQESTPEQAVERKFYETRIPQLSKRQAELEERILQRGERSVDLELRAAELQQLQVIVRELSIKLESLDVEAAAAPRIRVIQKAM